MAAGNMLVQRMKDENSVWAVITPLALLAYLPYSQWRKCSRQGAHCCGSWLVQSS